MAIAEKVNHHATNSFFRNILAHVLEAFVNKENVDWVKNVSYSDTEYQRLKLSFLYADMHITPDRAIKMVRDIMIGMDASPTSDMRGNMFVILDRQGVTFGDVIDLILKRVEEIEAE